MSAATATSGQKLPVPKTPAAAASTARLLLALSRDRSVSCEQVNGLVRAHLDRVRAKRAALNALEKQLVALDGQCASGHRVADCGILEELIHAAHGEACACHPGARAK